MPRLTATGLGGGGAAQRSGKSLYVVQVGARPEAQGRGLGGALLRRVTDWADAQGLPCYLGEYQRALSAAAPALSNLKS